MKALIRYISLEAIIGKTDHFFFGKSDCWKTVEQRGVRTQGTNTLHCKDGRELLIKSTSCSSGSTFISGLTIPLTSLAITYPG